MTDPFLRWPGGKRRLLGELRQHMPETYKGYFEPFIGGGALFLAERPDYGYIGDANPELANVYNVVKHKPTQLIAELALHRNTAKDYYKVRQADRDADFTGWSDVRRAARFVFLNRTCFNGLCRMNAKGQLNMAYGRLKNPDITQARAIWAAHATLRRVRIAHASFDEVLKLARPGDFVYFDPPYVPLSPTANFTDYAAGGFGADKHRELWQLCVKLHRRGIKWMVSNSRTPQVLDLWRAFTTHEIDARRTIAAGPKGRGRVKEVLVTNY